MRSIPLKTLGPLHVVDDAPGAREAVMREEIMRNGPPLDYRRQLVEILINPAEGLTAADVRQRGRVADKIEDEPSASVLLEEAEYDTLRKALAETRWRLASRNIRRFLDDIEGAQEIEVKAAA